jgi:hypothetical protein
MKTRGFPEQAGLIDQPLRAGAVGVNGGQEVRLSGVDVDIAASL